MIVKVNIVGQDLYAGNWRNKIEKQRDLSPDSLIYSEEEVDNWSVLYFNMIYFDVVTNSMGAPAE